MIRINDFIGPLGEITPDCYIATSVADFLKEKDHLTPPSLTKFINPLMWLQGRLAYVKFSNVNLERITDLSVKDYRISDLSGEFEVYAPEPEWAYHKSARMENLQFGRQYDLSVILWFWPNKGEIELCRTKKNGPPERDHSFSLSFELEPKLQSYR